MKNARNSLSVVAVLLSAIALCFATPDKPVTGNALARALSEVARTAGATEISRRLLESAQAKNSSAPLTEAGAAALLKIAGLPVTTSYPDRALTLERADALIRAFGSSLQARATQPSAASGKAGVPESVDDCLVQANHGQCVKCCKDMGGGSSSCAKVCMAINKPSESEPLP